MASPVSASFPLNTLISTSNFAEHPEYLRRGMDFIRIHAWAKNTVRTVSSEMKTFFRYAKLANLVRLPLTGADLCFYAMWLIMQGICKTSGSLAQYISAVRGYCLRLRQECPTPSQYPPLKQIISGVKRAAQHRTKKSLPVTPKILRNLLTTTPQHTLNGREQATLQVFKALALTYYLSMLRCSSLVAVSGQPVDPRRILCWGRVKNIDEAPRRSVALHVHLAKTNQHNARVHVAPLTASDDQLLCPIRALDGLMALYGVSNCGVDTPVFRVPTANGTWAPVYRRKFDRWFRARLQQMGADPEKYTLHAFRHGGIQEVLLAESNYALCRLSSDHSSDAILQYCELPASRRLRISENVNAGLASNSVATQLVPPFARMTV